MRRSVSVFGIAAGLLLVWALVAGVTQTDTPLPSTPAFPALGPDLRISRADFAALVDALSEPEGYFDTDNFITNETSYLHVIDRLADRVAPGGVYFGVGPGQNFSYIVHTDPSLAIVADIRRQNLLQHLVFKVLIERAGGRLDYLCTLLARDCRDLPATADFPDLLAGVRLAPFDRALLDRTIAGVRQTLTGEYGMNLSALDLERIEYVQTSFAGAGLALRFSTLGRPSPGYPTFGEILLERDLGGQYRSYLSTDALFAELQEFQRENRLIPVVGDFAGTQSLPAVAGFLREQSLEVSVFYASNVEFYLFDSPEWDQYLENLRQFPFDDDAVFVRSYFPTGFPMHPQNVPGHRPTSLVQSVRGFLEDAAARRHVSYWDVVSRHLY